MLIRLTELLKDPSIKEADRQTIRDPNVRQMLSRVTREISPTGSIILQSLRTLADKGDLTARVALDNSSPSPHGDLRNLSFAAVFDSCCKAGRSEKEFEFWKQWRRAILADVDILARLDSTVEEIDARRSTTVRIDEGLLYSYCKSRGMTVPETRFFSPNWARAQPTITTGLSTMRRPVPERVRRSRTTAGFSAD